MSSECSGWSFPTNFFCDRLRFKKLHYLLKIIIAKFLQQLNPCIAILKKFAERESRSLIIFNHFRFHYGVSTKFVESGKKHDNIKKKRRTKKHLNHSSHQKMIDCQKLEWWCNKFHLKGSSIFRKVV